MDDFLLNEHEVNYSDAPTFLTQDDIVFDGYSLQNTGFITSSINYEELKNIELNTFKYSRIDGGGVLSKYYRGRQITIKGTIKADTAAAFATLIDEVKKNIRLTEGNLDIRPIGSTEVRRIKATLTNLDLPRQHFNITFCEITLVFTTAEPFFYAVTNQSITFEAKTGNFTEDMTHEGSAEKSPRVYFVFGAGTTATALTITDPDGRVLTVTTAITNGDVVLVDGDNKVVELNGTEIDFSGSFPIFSPGGNNFTVGFTGTVLADVSFILQKNYL